MLAAGGLTILPLAQPARAALTGATLVIAADGTEQFDGDNAPGNDAGPANGIVRTNDTVLYNMNFSSDASGVTDPVIRSTLPAGMVWTIVPPLCTGTGSPASGIYDSGGGEGGDQRLLVCRLPSFPAATTAKISPVARVTIDSRQGEQKPVSFSVDSDEEGGPFQSGTETVTVSAAPFYDLRKVRVANVSSAPGPGPGGTQPGRVQRFAFGITVQHPSRTGQEMLKGMSPLASPITFTDDLTRFAPNAVLYDWGTDGPGCRTIFGSSFVPNSRIAGDNATSENSVPDTGTITCTRGDRSFDITLTGTDTTGPSFPTQMGSGAALAAGDLFVATGQVSIWLPSSDIIDAGGTLSMTDTFSGFEPVSVTGQPNAPEPAANNSVTTSVSEGIGWSLAYRDYVTGGAPTGSTGVWTGDLRASTGYRVIAMVNLEPRVIEAVNVILCAVYDRSSLRLVAGNGGGPPAVAGIDPDFAGQSVIEYGRPSAYPSSFADMRSTTCEDGDATWSTDPADPALGAPTANGFAGGVDRVRLRFLAPVPADGQSYLHVNLEVTGHSTLDLASNPGGTLLTTFARVRHGDPPTWRPTTYDPVTLTGNQSGDRITWVPGATTVAKTTVEATAGSGNTFIAGTTARISLQPAVTVNGSPTVPVRDVVLTDVLPDQTPRLTVVPPVDQPAGTQVQFCSVCDGSDWTAGMHPETFGVRWLFGDVAPGTVLPAVSFGAAIPLSATQALQYVNTATMSSPDDPAPVEDRSGTASMVIVVPAAVVADKSAPVRSVPRDTPLEWTIVVLNGTSQQTVQHADIIDVLPHNGDDRTPRSTFSGRWRDIDVGEQPGLETWVSSAAPDVLDLADGSADGHATPGNPGDPGYVPTGTGIWACRLGQMGTAGCPAAADVTAVRIESTEGFALPPESARVVSLTLTPLGNASGDVYTNRLAMSVERGVLPLPVFSGDATILVAAPGITVTNRVCNQADPAVCAEPLAGRHWVDSTRVPDDSIGTFLITVTNTGNAGGEVRVTNVLPAPLEHVPGSASATTGDVSQFPQLWHIPELAAGGTATVVFQFRAPVASGVVTNVASGTIREPFGHTQADSDTTRVQVVSTAVALSNQVCVLVDPSMCDPDDDSHWSSSATVAPGSLTAWRLVALNPGDTDLIGLTVDATIPPSMSFVPGSADTPTGDVSGFPPSWELGALSRGDRAVLTYRLVAPPTETTVAVPASLAGVDEFDRDVAAEATATLTTETAVVPPAIGPVPPEPEPEPEAVAAGVQPAIGALPPTGALITRLVWLGAMLALLGAVTIRSTRGARRRGVTVRGGR